MGQRRSKEARERGTDPAGRSWLYTKRKEEKMAQAMKDIPRKDSELRRQKGATPIIVYAMVALLLAAFVVYYGPVLWDLVQGNINGSSTALSNDVPQ